MYQADSMSAENLSDKKKTAYGFPYTVFQK